jgi:hypothetical protein
MKIQRKLSSATIIEAEGTTVAELFEALASLEEIFAGHEQCGLCQKVGVRYQVRRDKQGNKYYQAVCLACAAEFRFGVRRDPPGQLFPQLKTENGDFKPNGGWAKWESSYRQNESAPRPQQSAPRPPQSAPRPQASEQGRDVPF